MFLLIEKCKCLPYRLLELVWHFPKCPVGIVAVFSPATGRAMKRPRQTSVVVFCFLASYEDALFPTIAIRASVRPTIAVRQPARRSEPQRVQASGRRRGSSRQTIAPGRLVQREKRAESTRHPTAKVDCLGVHTTQSPLGADYKHHRDGLLIRVERTRATSPAPLPLTGAQNRGSQSKSGRGRRIIARRGRFSIMASSDDPTRWSCSATVCRKLG